MFIGFGGWIRVVTSLYYVWFSFLFGDFGFNRFLWDNLSVFFVCWCFWFSVWGRLFYFLTFRFFWVVVWDMVFRVLKVGVNVGCRYFCVNVLFEGVIIVFFRGWWGAGL